MKVIVLLITILLNISMCLRRLTPNSESDFELTDDNPIVYCLRAQKNLDDEQIKQFLEDIQDPKKAVTLFPSGGKLSNCVKKRREELFQNGIENDI